MADFSGVVYGQDPISGFWADEGGTVYTYVQLFGSQFHGGGGTPPVITFVDPVPGGDLEQNQNVVVDVTDVDADMELMILTVDLGGFLFEVIYRAGFADRYEGSTVVEITDGFRYTLSRRGGWPVGSMPDFYVDVTDATGNVA